MRPRDLQLLETQRPQAVVPDRSKGSTRGREFLTTADPVGNLFRANNQSCASRTEAFLLHEHFSKHHTSIVHGEEESNYF